MYVQSITFFVSADLESVLNPITIIREYEYTLHRIFLKDFKFICSPVLYPFLLLLLVFNILVVIAQVFLVHMGSLYLWHKSLFYIIIVLLSIRVAVQMSIILLLFLFFVLVSCVCNNRKYYNSTCVLCVFNFRHHQTHICPFFSI